MKLTLVEKRAETSSVTSFFFQSESPLTWRAGQFLRYNLPHENADDRGSVRYFTIASAPFERLIRLTLRIDNGRLSSFKQALNQLKISDYIEAKGPSGSFTVADTNQAYVFLAGGIGISPFRSILLDLDHRGSPLNAWLLYANRDQEIVFKQEFDDLSCRQESFRVRYLIDPERLNAAAVRQDVADFDSRIFYLSGPEPMVKVLEGELASLGVKPEMIKKDYFPGYVKV